MTSFKDLTIDGIFTQACHKLWFEPDFVTAPRAQKTRELLNAICIIDDPTKRLIGHPLRALSLAYFCGEFIWYQNATGNVDDISYYSSFWRKLVDENGQVSSCYGKRIFKGEQQSQWAKCRELLHRDPDTRRAVMMINTPEDQKINSPDVPCTNSLQFLIRDRKLYLTTHMRSNDLIWGFGYDVPIFTLWQEMMLVELQQLRVDVIGLGEYTHFATSLHSYMRHEHIVEYVALEDNPAETTAMPAVDTKFLDELSSLITAERQLRHATQKAIKSESYKSGLTSLKTLHSQAKTILLTSDLSHWMIDHLYAYGIYKIDKAQES